MRNFLQLLLLAAMWAPSFVLIKIGLTGGLDAGGDAGYPPVILASLRVALGALFMLSILKFKGRPLPRDRESWMRVLPMGLFATALPFILFSWGEQHADSALAAILNATTPIFTVMIAQFALADEKITLQKAVGVLIGFVGIALTFWPSIDFEGLADGSGGLALLGLGAFLIAGACYGFSTVYARKHLMGMPPLVAPTMQLIIASAAMLVASIGLESREMLEMRPSMAAHASVVFMAVVGTALAYVVFYDLIRRASATYASLVTYILPPAGILLSVWILGEEMHMSALLGTVLIIFAVVVVTRSPQTS